MRRVYCCEYHFEFKKEDMWIGAFWKKTPGEYADRLDVWVCLIPMVPFHYMCYYRAFRKKGVA